MLWGSASCCREGLCYRSALLLSLALGASVCRMLQSVCQDNEKCINRFWWNSGACGCMHSDRSASRVCCVSRSGILVSGNGCLSVWWMHVESRGARVWSIFWCEYVLCSDSQSCWYMKTYVYKSSLFITCSRNPWKNNRVLGSYHVFRSQWNHQWVTAIKFWTLNQLQYLEKFGVATAATWDNTHLREIIYRLI